MNQSAKRTYLAKRFWEAMLGNAKVKKTFSHDPKDNVSTSYITKLNEKREPLPIGGFKRAVY